MAGAPKVDLPPGGGDERELLLAWLAYLRGAVLRKLDGLSDDQARWRPNRRLISVLGIVNHLTHVERRWIDGGFLGAVVGRSEEEFDPDSELTVEVARTAYLGRAASTEATVRTLPSLETPCARRSENGTDLRWVLLHLVNETARHAGHADAVRELLDGSKASNTLVAEGVSTTNAKPWLYPADGTRVQLATSCSISGRATGSSEKSRTIRRCSTTC